MATETGTQGLIDQSVDQDKVLESLRIFNEEYLRREQGLVLLAVQWAKLNPGLKRTLRDGSPNTSTDGVDPEDLIWEELAEKGCPYFDNLAVPAFAIAAGVTEFQARKLIHEALMLVHLLPRVWQRARSGEVDVWRARALADECWDLTPEAIDYVDRVMSLSNARHTIGGRDGVIKEARIRHMPEEVDEDETYAQQGRGVEISTEEWGTAGVAHVGGVLDLPDAVDLEKAVAAGADALKKLGSDAPLDVRRSWALGDIARNAQMGATPLLSLSDLSRRSMPSDAPRFHPDCACALGLLPPGKAAPLGKVMMYLHLTPGALCNLPNSGNDPGANSAKPPGSPLLPESDRTALPKSGKNVIRVEGVGIPRGFAVTSELVKSWLQRPTVSNPPGIIFRPIIDLNDHSHVEAYEIPERLKEQVKLRDVTCVFPWCNRKAENSDCDHILAWKPDGSGGPTCTCNLAPLCRSHHRAKTHADNHVGSRYTWWNYEALGEGKYLWTGPKGTRLLRTNTGVVDVSKDDEVNGLRPAPQEPRELTDVTTRDVELEEKTRFAERVVDQVSTEVAQELSDQSSEEDLEFPVLQPKKRRKGWRELARVEDVKEDPPSVAPGSLSARIADRKHFVPSSLDDSCRDYMTDQALLGKDSSKKVWRQIGVMESIGHDPRQPMTVMRPQHLILFSLRPDIKLQMIGRPPKNSG